MKRAIIVIATFVLVLIGAAVAFVINFERDVGQPSRELSKMVSVSTSLARHFVIITSSTVATLVLCPTCR